MSFRILAMTAISLLLAGCSIHPVPEDVTGVNTYQIVRQIRCEARAALRDTIAGWLESDYHDELRALGKKYRENPEAISSFHYDLFSGAKLSTYREVVKLFYDAGMAMNFDLTMSEQNNLDAGLGFEQAFAHANLALGFAGTAHKTRQNQRTFTITDTFSGLLTKVPKDYCSPKYIAGKDYTYPLAGNIGIDKMLKDFIELTLLGALSNEKDPKGPPTMTDTLTFTTGFTGSVNPVVLFTPVTHAFHAGSMSATGLVGRTDVHQVTIGLAIASASVLDVSSVRSSLTRRGLVVGQRVTGGGTETEQLAVRAVDQVKSRELKLIPGTP